MEIDFRNVNVICLLAITKLLLLMSVCIVYLLVLSTMHQLSKHDTWLNIDGIIYTSGGHMYMKNDSKRIEIVFFVRVIAFFLSFDAST